MGVLANGLGSLLSTFLSGNWIGVIFHPLVLTVLAFTLGMGWAYKTGRSHERMVQARAILDMNEQIGDWRTKYENADAESELRLKLALENWRKTMGTNVAVASSCRLDPTVITKINDIAGE